MTGPITAELRKMTLPTGAWVEYAYNLDIEEDGPPTAPIETIEAPRERIVSKKLTHDGTIDTWTYDVSTISGSVSGPDGSVTTEEFYPHDPAWAATYGGADGRGGLVYRSSQSGKVITERHWILKSFTGGAIIATGSSQRTPFNPVVDAEYTTVMNSIGTPVKMNARTFTHDYNGNVLTVNEYDWFNPASVSRDAQGVPVGVPAGATLVRTTTNSYHNPATAAGSGNVYAKRVIGNPPTPLILNALQESITGVSKAQVSYDGQAYGVAPTLGNVTKEARWDNQGSKWLNATHSYDIYGNRVSTTDPRGKVTQFVFGDSTKANVTQIIVDPQNGTGQQTTSIAYDISTGLVTSQTDPNGQTTTSDYTNQLTFGVDPFGRPGIVSGPAVSSTVGSTTFTNQRRQTRSIYRDSLRQAEVISDLNTQGDGLLKSRTTSDQIGRVTMSEASENGSYTIATKNVYKYRQSPNKGTITFSTNPYKSDPATTDGWTRATTDEIGRVERVETFIGGPATPPPDEGTNANSTGSVVTTYNGEQTTVRDQASKQRRSTVDGLG